MSMRRWNTSTSGRLGWSPELGVCLEAYAVPPSAPRSGRGRAFGISPREAGGEWNGGKGTWIREAANIDPDYAARVRSVRHRGIWCLRSERVTAGRRV